MPQPASVLGKSVNQAAIRGVVGESAASSMVFARDLVEGYEEGQAVRSGALRRGKQAPDFRTTSGRPHYLQSTAADEHRAKTAAARFGVTLGGLGKSSRVHAARNVGPVANATAEVRAAEGSADDMGLSLEDDVAGLGMVLPSRSKRSAGLGSGVDKAALGGDGLGAGRGGGITSATRAADAAIARRMQRPLAYLRNPRYLPGKGLGETRAKGRAARSAAATLSVIPDKPPPARVTLASSGRSAIPHGPAQDRAHLDGSTTLAGLRELELVAPGAAEALAGPLLVTPPCLRWEGYEVGQDASAVVAVRNNDTLSRNVRFLPPSTPSFSMAPPVYSASGGGGSGVVAPGMSVRVQVTFHPASLADAEDELVIITEGGKFRVPLLAARSPPHLSLPASLDAGLCLQHGIVTTEVPVSNTGTGRGAYRLLPARAWPLVDPDAPPPPSLEEPPFSIAPTHFELEPGQGTTLRVRFRPPRAGEFAVTLLALCDNADVTEHTLRGVCSDLRVGVTALQNTPLPHPILSPTQWEARTVAMRAVRAALTALPGQRVPHAAAPALAAAQAALAGLSAALGAGDGTALATAAVEAVAALLRRTAPQPEAADARGQGQAARPPVHAALARPGGAPSPGGKDDEERSTGDDGSASMWEPGSHIPMDDGGSLAGQQPLPGTGPDAEAPASATSAPASPQTRQPEPASPRPALTGKQAWGAAWQSLSAALRGDAERLAGVENPPLHLRFDSLLPGGSIWKCVTVRNDTPLPLPFEWVVLPQRPAPPTLSIVQVEPTSTAGAEGKEEQDGVLAEGALRVGAASGQARRVYERLRVAVKTGDGELTMSTGVGPSVKHLAGQLGPAAVRAGEVDSLTRHMQSGRGGGGLGPTAPPLTLLDAEEGRTPLAFTVEPSRGALPPHSSTSFRVYFTPPAHTAFRASAYLLVDGVPTSGSGGPGFLATRLGGAAPTPGAEADPTHDPACVLTPSPAVPTTRVTASVVTLAGAGDAPSVMVAPPLTRLPRPLLPGEVTWSTIRVSNPCRGSISLWFGNATLAFRPHPSSRFATLAVSPALSRGTGVLAAPGWLRVANWSTGSDGVLPAGPWNPSEPAVWPPILSARTEPSTARSADDVPPPALHEVAPVCPPAGGTSLGMTQGTVSSLAAATAGGGLTPRSAVPPGATMGPDTARAGVESLPPSPPGAVAWPSPRRAAVSAGSYVDVSVAFRAPAGVGAWAVSLPLYVYAGTAPLTAPSADVAAAAAKWEAAQLSGDDPSSLQDPTGQHRNPAWLPSTLAPARRYNVQLQAVVRPGDVAFGDAEVDLGLVKVSEQLTSGVRIRNLGHKPTAFRVEHQPRPEALAAGASRRHSQAGDDDDDDDDEDAKTVATLSTAISGAGSVAGESIASAFTDSTMKSVVKDGLRLRFYPAAGLLPPGGQGGVELVSKGGRVPQRVREFIKVSAVVVEEDLLLVGTPSAPGQRPPVLPSSLLVGGVAGASPGPRGAQHPLLSPALSRATLSWHSLGSAAEEGGAATPSPAFSPVWTDGPGAEPSWSPRDTEGALLALGSRFHPTLCRVRGEVQSPRVVVSPHDVDLGLLFVGCAVSTSFTLTNLSNLTTEFRTDGYTGLSAQQVAMLLPSAKARQAAAGTISPPSLPPNRSFDELLAEMNASGGPGAQPPRKRTVGFSDSPPHTATGGAGRGDAHAPDAPVWDGKYQLGRRLGDALKGMLTPEGIRYIATFSTPGGRLQAKESLDITLTLTPVRVGAIDTHVTLHVRGMLIPLGLRVRAQVRPLALAFGVQGVDGVPLPAHLPTPDILRQWEDLSPPGCAEPVGLLRTEAGGEAAGLGPDTHSDAAHLDPHVEFQAFLEREEAQKAANAAREAAAEAAIVEQAPSARQEATPRTKQGGVRFGGVEEHARDTGGAAAAPSPEDPLPSLRQAFDAAVGGGARLGTVPAINFGSAFQTFTRRSVTVTVYNLSGVPSALRARVSRYPVWDGPAAAEVAQAKAFAAKLQGRTARSKRSAAKAILAADDESDPLAAGPLLVASIRAAQQVESGEGDDAASVSTWGSGSKPRKLLHAGAFEKAERLQSGVGRALLSARDEREVMKEQLALQNGVAFTVDPDTAAVPAFGSAQVTVTCVSDFPGTYTDELVLSLDGAKTVRVPITAVVGGSPLQVLADVAGLSVNEPAPPGTLALLRGSPAADGVSVGGFTHALQARLGLRGAGGAGTVPLLRFGQAPAGGPSITKLVTLENTSPMDAHLQWHLVQDPAKPPPLVKVALTPGDARVTAALSLADERAGGAARPPPFRITPSRAVVPAHGKVTFSVEAWPTLPDTEDRDLARALGWDPSSLVRRGMLTADAVWVEEGTAPEAQLVRDLEDPLPTSVSEVAAAASAGQAASPGGPTSPGALVQHALAIGREGIASVGAGRTAEQSSESSEAISLGDAADPGVAAAELKACLHRDLLRIRLAVEPTHPRLALDKAPMAPGHPPVVKFSAWVTAPAGHASYFRTLTLSNPMEVPLAFDLDIAGPFAIHEVVDNTRRLPPAGSTGAAATLARKGFRVSTLHGAGSYTVKGPSGSSRAPPARGDDMAVAALPDLHASDDSSDEEGEESSKASPRPDAAGAGQESAPPPLPVCEFNLPPQSSIQVVVQYCAPDFSRGGSTSVPLRSTLGSTSRSRRAASARRGAPANAPPNLVVAVGDTADVVRAAAEKFYSGRPGAEEVIATSTRRVLGTPDAAPASSSSVLAVTRPALRDEELGALALRFASGHSQHIILRAQRLRALVVAQPAVLDLGTVHVEDSARGTFALCNPTVVQASWSVQHVPWPPALPRVAVDASSLGLPLETAGSGARAAAQAAVQAYAGLQPVDDPSVFTFPTSSGTLEGPTAPPQSLAVEGVREQLTAASGAGGLPPLPLPCLFKPTSDALYRCRFRVEVHRGDSFDVVVYGRGTYDEEKAAAARALL